MKSRTHPWRLCIALSLCAASRLPWNPATPIVDYLDADPLPSHYDGLWRRWSGQLDFDKAWCQQGWTTSPPRTERGVDDPMLSGERGGGKPAAFKRGHQLATPTGRSSGPAYGQRRGLFHASPFYPPFPRPHRGRPFTAYVETAPDAVEAPLAEVMIDGFPGREAVKDVLTRLPSATNQQLAELTPKNWKAARQKAAAAAA